MSAQATTQQVIPSIEVPIAIPLERISDIMVTAIEGNPMTRAWCNGIFLKDSANKPKPGQVWYSDPNVYANTFTIHVEEILDESKEAKGDNIKTHVMTQKTLRDGFKVFAAKAPHAFGEFLAENEDSIVADVWLQCIVLGEVVYG